MILILVPHRVVEVELAVAGDSGAQKLSPRGVWPQQRVTGKMPGKEVAERKREDTQFVSGAVDTHCVCDFIHLSFRFLSASSHNIRLGTPNEGIGKIAFIDRLV